MTYMVYGNTTYDWHTDVIRVHTSDIRMTYEHLRVIKTICQFAHKLCFFIFITIFTSISDCFSLFFPFFQVLEMYNSTWWLQYFLFYKNIRVTYGWYTSTYKWHTNDIRIHASYIGMTYDTNDIRISCEWYKKYWNV